jgi:osmotically-inducible protein OsmY
MTPVAEPPDPVVTPPPADPVVDAALAALDQTGQSWLRRVVVSAEDGAIVLRGRVPSFYLKQTAQTIVLAIPGVTGLRNELQVRGEP